MQELIMPQNFIFAKNKIIGMKNLTKKIVKLNGGLGNQMFQYAFACALEDKFKDEVTFDFCYFDEVKLCDTVTSRVFELDAFGICCPKPNTEDMEKVRRPEFKSKFKNTLAKKFPALFGINYVREKYTSIYDKKVLNCPDYIYYEGYFQNEKYFKHLRKELLEKFSVKVPINDKNQAVLDKIQNTNSVSIHVRRGDYVSLDYVNKIHGTCSLDYYERAIDYIAKHVENPHFFMFSDDIDWVIKNLKIDYPFTVVDFNQGKGWFDMHLMKNCKHNIVANSSFSWWGAWLNNNPYRIVIAPEKWTAQKQKCDIIPSDWIKL